MHHLTTNGINMTLWKMLLTLLHYVTMNMKVLVVRIHHNIYG